MKKWFGAIILTFLVPVFALFFVSLFDVDATESEDENRKLATMQELTAKSLLNGSFRE